MDENEIKSNAEDYAKRNEQTLINRGPDGYLTTDYESLVDCYLSGAHSRDKEIKELKEEIESLKELMASNVKLHNPWINVKDKMPPKNQSTALLVACKDADSNTYVYRDAFYSDDFEDFVSCYDGEHLDFDYWMIISELKEN